MEIEKINENLLSPEKKAQRDKYVGNVRIVKSVRYFFRKSLRKSEYYQKEPISGRAQFLPTSFAKLGFLERVIVNIHPDRKFVVVHGQQRVEQWTAEFIPVDFVNLSKEEEMEAHFILNERLTTNQEAYEFLGNRNWEEAGFPLPPVEGNDAKDDKDYHEKRKEITDRNKDLTISYLKFAMPKTLVGEIKRKLNALGVIMKLANRNEVIIQTINETYDNHTTCKKAI